MTDISFLKAVIKRRRNGKHNNRQTYTQQTQTIKSIPRRGGIKGGLLFPMTTPANLQRGDPDLLGGF